MNRRQFLLTSLTAAVAAIAAPALKHLPQSAGGVLPPYDLAEFYRRLLARQLYKGTVFISTPRTFSGISEFINAR